MSTPSWHFWEFLNYLSIHKSRISKPSNFCPKNYWICNNFVKFCLVIASFCTTLCDDDAVAGNNNKKLFLATISLRICRCMCFFKVVTLILDKLQFLWQILQQYFCIITYDLGHSVLKIFMNQPIYIKLSIFYFLFFIHV